MTAVECPFFPGKLCCGTCPNNEHNAQEVRDQAEATNSTIENIRAFNRVDPNRFLMARLNSTFDGGFFLECEQNLIQ